MANASFRCDKDSDNSDTDCSVCQTRKDSCKRDVNIEITGSTSDTVRVFPSFLISPSTCRCRSTLLRAFTAAKRQDHFHCEAGGSLVLGNKDSWVVIIMKVGAVTFGFRTVRRIVSKYFETLKVIRIITASSKV